MEKNPFINRQKLIANLDGEMTHITLANINKYFNHLFILVKKDNYKIPSEFYQHQIKKEVLEECSKHLILYKTNLNIIENKLHFNNLLLLSDNLINKYNIFNYELENINLVLPIFNINFENINIFLEQFDTTYTLENLFKIRIMNDFFDHDNYLFLEKIIDNLSNNYWNNFKLNMTKKFSKRKLRAATHLYSDDIKKIFNSVKDYDMNTYCDYSLIDKTEYKTSIDTLISKEDISKLALTLFPYFRFKLFLQLMISEKYYHLINNKVFISLVRHEIKTNPEIVKYYLSYAWIRFYADECTEQVSTNSPFVFDIETANMLPLFPFSHNTPKDNPYMPILIDDYELCPISNICGICDSENNKYQNKGICDLGEFRENLNVFCTGNYKINIFEDINFSDIDMAICGSVMAACIQKSHPLMATLLGDTYNKIRDRFYSEYYSEADIDIMIKAPNIFKYFDKVNYLLGAVGQNLKKITSTLVKITINVSSCLSLTPDFVMKNINTDDIFAKNKIEYIKANINDPKIKKKFYPLYQKLSNEYFNKISKNENYNDYIDILSFTNLDFKIYISKKYNNIFKASYKFTLENELLKHSLEIFHITQNDFMHSVSNFHLPCVRAYYDGNNVYMTPSCISSHMTFMNIDIKYVASTTDPIEIINKYRSRGFGTWLNNNEKSLFIKYITAIPYWRNRYNINMDNHNMIINNKRKIEGPLELDHDLLRDKSKPYLKVNTRGLHYYSDKPNIKSRYPNYTNNNTIINFYHLLTIDRSGSVVPFKKWIIQAI